MTLLRRNSKGLYSGLLVLFCCFIIPILAQSKTEPAQVNAPVSPKDTIQNAGSRTSNSGSGPNAAPADSAKKIDSTSVKKSQGINEIVDYASRDSLVFMGEGTGMLYGKGKVAYGELKLEAGFIQMKMDSSLLSAAGRLDSVGKTIEDPVFEDKSGKYAVSYTHLTLPTN
jgi:hypothetical protein